MIAAGDPLSTRVQPIDPADRDVGEDRAMGLRSITPAVLLTALLTTSGCGLWDIERGEDGQVLKETPADVFDLREGDCLNDSQVVDASELQLTDITLVPCSEAHIAEVYVDVQIDGDGPPDDARLTELFEEHCVDSFVDYVGGDFRQASAANLSVTSFFPTEESWTRGDRLYQCLLVGTDGFPLVGSAKGLLADS
ncbi:septum formation family protein [Zhihengliuella halotolerans]|uniref:septum formation family protein n=1 Tax=Zhihengliuella halotolerans TaxID=370736 RepID=UPI000C80898F|nr:septum formation family protein [Zhihengliuella halotolerans]